MTAKEYLQTIYKIKKQIERIEDRKSAIRAEMYSARSPSGAMSPDKVQSSLSGDQMLRLIGEVDELEHDMVAREKRLIKARRLIADQIDGLPDERHKAILHNRYELCMKWEDIAEKMHVDVRHVYRLHGQALLEFDKKYLSKGH